MTAPLVCFVETKRDEDVHREVVRRLPENWPFWLDPDYSEVEKQIKADPRWAAWAVKTQQTV